METLKFQTPLKKTKSKKNKISKSKQAKITRKITLLSENLKPVPFIPNPQTLISISAHEELFKDLHLWDFANLNLESDIKIEFLVDLIAYYDPNKRNSQVHEQRINLTRADLSRALLLPAKSQKKENLEFDAKKYGGGDEICNILWGFILNKMVFLEDGGILPDEVVNAEKMVREGRPNKVDWAGLVWELVEKEILDAPESGCCYYASHLMCLIKYQKPRLFEEEEKEEDGIEGEEAAVGEEDCIVEDVGDLGSDDKDKPKLSLGINDAGVSQCEGLSKEEFDKDLNSKERNVDKMEVDVIEEQEEKSVRVESDELNKVGGEGEDKGGKGNDGLDDEIGKLGGLGKGDGDTCKMVNDDMDVEHGELNKGNADKGKMVDDVLDGEAKFPALDRLTSSDFLHVMESNNNLSFGLDQPNREFLSMGGEMHDKNMSLELGQDGSFYFGNEHKRTNDEIDGHVDGFQQKRFRSDQPWEHTPAALGVDQLSREIQHVMEKVKMDIAEKEKDYINVVAQVQYVNEVVQQKDEIIRSLESNRMEAMRKRQHEGSRFDHDLKNLSSILFGCKKAIKETQIVFAEYRNKCPMGGDNGYDISDAIELRSRFSKEKEDSDAKELKPCLRKEEEESDAKELKPCFSQEKEMRAEEEMCAEELKPCLSKEEEMCAKEPELCSIEEEETKEPELCSFKEKEMCAKELETCLSKEEEMHAKELEPCLSKEEEMRQIAQSLIMDFSRSWYEKIGKYANWITESAIKLGAFKEEVKLLKESVTKAKNQNHD